MRLALTLACTLCLPCALHAAEPWSLPANPAAASPAPAPAAAAAAAPGQVVQVTPATLQAEITRALKDDAGLWSDYDLDGDGKVSQVEVIVCLAKNPSFMREHFPHAFAAIDTDHDRTISIAELAAFLALAPAGTLGIQERSQSLHRDLTSQQGFDDPVNRKHFDPIAGWLPAGTVLEAGSVLVAVLQ
jgi:hypothetical protein